ncbi:hypothetical protein [Catenuloplanes japonicus]|uniref:hypothetical protein n=1 Tax=Catenuloplanes japonicus TaxID=33876 RepID=UPI000AC34363|nr:hypothetical protein [Catenuloplanes japonicus]
MTTGEGKGRFGLGDLGRGLGRLGQAAAGGVRKARDTVAEIREDYRRMGDNQPEIALVRPLLIPGEELRYVCMSGARVDMHVGANRKLADDLASALDPRALFGLLNVLNPVVWVEAVITPFRIVAALAAAPAVAAVAAVRTADGGVTQQPLTPEQEAFRVAFGLRRDQPLADQLAEIAYDHRYTFGGGLHSPAGVLLMLMRRNDRLKLAVSNTHLHAVEMPDRPDEGPDTRTPVLLWSLDRRHVTRIDSENRPLGYPVVITFDDGSWLRFVSGDGLAAQHRQFVDAVREIPGTRPSL